jgi:hypothetical protein
MNPDVAQAIPALRDRGLLPAEEAPRLLRVARGELLSVRAELRALLYAGVLLLTGGVGLLVEQNLERIGPVAIAAALGLGAAAALAWVFRVAPPFSWQEVPSPNLAFDYLLLLGILLGAADLAYGEAHFGWLGVHASWHLLILAALAALAAFRFDSRIVFSLALTSLAAWRGVSLGHLTPLGQLGLGGHPGATGTAGTVGTVGDMGWSAPTADALRWNAVGCGVLFAALGLTLARSGRKAHFEPVALHLGCLLALGGLAAGIFESSGRGLAWTGALLLAGGGLAAAAYRGRRFPLFAYGVVAAYAALTRLLAEGFHDAAAGCLWFAVSSVLMIGGLLAAHRRMKPAAEPLKLADELESPAAGPVTPAVGPTTPTAEPMTPTPGPEAP